MPFASVHSVQREPVLKVRIHRHTDTRALLTCLLAAHWSMLVCSACRNSEALARCIQPNRRKRRISRRQNNNIRQHRTAVLFILLISVCMISVLFVRARCAKVIATESKPEKKGSRSWLSIPFLPFPSPLSPPPPTPRATASPSPLLSSPLLSSSLLLLQSRGGRRSVLRAYHIGATAHGRCAAQAHTSEAAQGACAPSLSSSSD